MINPRATRTLALALAMAAPMALSACGSDDNSQPSNSASNSAAAPAGSASVNCPAGGTLTAEGSTAQKNAIEQAISQFQTLCPSVTINYNASGSGAGVKNFNAGQVDFAGSDSALKDADATAAQTRCGSPAWDLPMVIGPLAIAYNVPGVTNLTLSGELAFKIFNGNITSWDDPAIAALNPGVTLPKQAIKVFFRSDESGTTDNFTKYLKAAGGSTIEPGKKWNGPVGEGKEKNAGLASAVKATAGGISYIEWSYAQQNQLGVAAIQTGSGVVPLSSEAAGKMVSSAKQVGTGNDLALQLDYATKAPGAYPINLVTYEIVCSKYSDPAKAAGVKAFLKYFASAPVQAQLQGAGYAPLPADVATKVNAAIDAIG